MKLALKNLKKRELGAVLLTLVAFLMLSGRIFNPVAVFMIGNWLTSDNSTQTTITTFRWNGEWEQVTTFKNWQDRFPDGSGYGTPLVYKGRYSLTGSTFHLDDVQHYLRNGGTDELWIPCSDWEGHRGECITHAGILNDDEQQFDSKRIFTVVSNDWRSSKMTVHSPWSGAAETWKRQ